MTDEEKKILEYMIEDLRYLLTLEEILPDEVDDVLDKLKSEEAKAYLDFLRKGSKPEVALREAFLAGRAVLTKYLFGHIVPEINVGSGFIDYRIVAGAPNRFIILELKSLFQAEVEEGKGGVRNLKRIKQTKIRPDSHKEQIVKYVKEGGEFVILTNLKEWLFYNDNVTLAKFESFYSTDLFEFIKDFEIIANLVDYLERKEYYSIRGDLDKKFFESLKSWVDKLSEVEFEVDERKRIETIIGLINKFIFIQTLDDYGVVDFRWIKTTWEHAEQRWHAKGKLQILRKFFEEVMEFFWLHYDTELFQGEALANLKQTEKNIELFYRNLQLILGIAYWQTGVGGYKGIIQYNFKLIDEDVFGKAYETFLADVRHDEGIYYTPRYITQYIAEDAVGRVFRTLLDEIKASVQREDFDRTKELSERFISVKVLDPACGSGSFLIKAVRKIWSFYKELDSAVAAVESKYSKFDGTLVRPKDAEKKLEKLLEIKQLLRITNDRKLVSHILVRHIHANDLDSKALSVAKVNVWLEAIKLAPKQFRYDTLPEGTNYVLPHLEMNFRNGDSVVGLPEDMTVDYLAKNHTNEITQLFELRNQYVKEPTNPELIDRIEGILEKLRNDVDEEFKRYLKAKELPLKILEQTRPLHWALEFWYLYFNENGKPEENDSRGTDIVIGNPPYERIEVLNKKSPVYVQYLNGAGFNSAIKQYDLAAIFIEKGYTLLKKTGLFCYIVSNKFVDTKYGEGIRDFLSRQKSIETLIDFGDQQVFEDASTYTALLFLNKSENQTTKYTLVKRLERTHEQLVGIAAGDTASTFSVIVKPEELTGKPWVFTAPQQESVMKKSIALPKLGDVTSRIFEGIHTSADPVYICRLVEDGVKLSKVWSYSTKREHLVECDLLRPLLKGKDIKRWVVDSSDLVAIFPYEISQGRAHLIDEITFAKKYSKTWEYLLGNKKLLEERDRGKWKGKSDWYAYGRRQNLEQFDQTKVITQVLARRSTFALDLAENLYFVGGGNAGAYGITLKPESGLSLELLCALLNSSLLQWHLQKGSTRFRGGFYSYGKRFIEKLPIKVPSDGNNSATAKTIESLVHRAIELKKMRCTLLSVWKTTSIAMKNSERTLAALLSQDATNTREGRFQDAWSQTVSFYPSGNDDMLTKRFADFVVRGEDNQSKLVLYGIDDDNKEELVYEIVFNTREHMLHIYLSILSLLESRSKARTLSDVFEKTQVPVIQPDIVKNTPNILRKLKDELGAKKAAAVHDVVKIENELESVEAKIDSAVFNLYGLDQSEIHLILENLSVLASYQQRVLEFFSQGV